MAITPAKSINNIPNSCIGNTCRAFNFCPGDNSALCQLIKDLQFQVTSTNHANKRGAINPQYSDIVLFPQDNRPQDADLPNVIKNALEFSFMARSGINFLVTYGDDIKDSVKTGCKCKFLVFNYYSPAIEYGADNPNFDKKNVVAAYEFLKEIKKKGKDQIEIHVLNHFAPFSFEYYKKDKEEEIIIIRPHFHTNFKPNKRPMFMLKKGDNWYEYFYNEFDTLWKKSQAWGKTQKWGTPKRIVVDGPPGAGKTTLLVGKSDRDDLGGNREFEGSFKESGYTIFGGLINESIKKMRNASGNPNMQPDDDWDTFFNYAITIAIEQYNGAKPDLISFYDRGIIFLEIFAKLGNYNKKLPDIYYNFIYDPKNRYDDPIFVFHPIPGYTVKPKPEDANIRNYDFEKLKDIHVKIVEVYKKYNYRVVEIEAPSDPDIFRQSKKVQDNINVRLTMLKEELGI